ncbi:MAG: type I methionyl aminopeptidase [Erysipelotrichaceae bacterium]
MTKAKSKKELDYMREAGRIVALAHKALEEFIQPGVSSKAIDTVVEKLILEHNATPSFKGLYGFPAATCISINNVLVHGIPDDTILHQGDIVSVDIGACYHGYHGDSAWTYAVGEVSEEIHDLMEVTKQSLYEGMKQAKPGNRVGDISHAIADYVYSHGYTIPQDFSGHGIGTSVHENPIVPNFGPPGKGMRLFEGMTIAIEPMVHMGKAQTRVLKDDWTVVTKDGSASAHYEHTIAITKDGYEILTILRDKEELPDNG